MHAGHNFGRIILKAETGRKPLKWTARKFTEKDRSQSSYPEKEIERLYRDYLDFRLKEDQLKYLGSPERKILLHAMNRQAEGISYDEAVSGTDLFCGRSAGDRLYFSLKAGAETRISDRPAVRAIISI